MKKKLLSIIGCVALAAVISFNVRLVKSDFSIGSTLSLYLIQSEAFGEATEGYIHKWLWSEQLQQFICCGTGTQC